MVCSSITIPSRTTTACTRDFFKEHQHGLRRSVSGKELCTQAGIRRSHSDNHISFSISPVCAASIQPSTNTSGSVGISPFQIASSIFPKSLRSFLFNPETSRGMSVVDKDLNEDGDPMESSESDEESATRANWVERLLEIRRHWRNRQQEEAPDGDEAREADETGNCTCDADDGNCMVDYNSDEEAGGEVKYDRERFSRFLTRVPWYDTKYFSKLAFLCNMAYVISEIKAMDLRRYYSLNFVTSSLEKKAEVASMKEKLDEDSTRVPLATLPVSESNSERTVDTEQKRPTRLFKAYEKIAASAATYVQLRSKHLLPHGSESNQESDSKEDQFNEKGDSSTRVYKSEVAAYVAASTMTAVVAAGEKEKQETARDLQSLHSSPCEWFVCDDLRTYTRCFVIQGSESFASWQANLFFEPAKFEGTEVLVHRGIYEAAKGIYEQFMPEIIEHLDKFGERAKIQFTGHSLGGSLSLLVHLMLLTRKVVNPSSLRPVVTFGSPFVFCGGEKVLDDLGLDENQVHCVMMHRDIVPRAFSCDYPNQIARLLKRLNGPLRSHPCLLKKKMLYSPLGKLFILQPDERSSPPHPLLPPGSALYALDKTERGYTKGILKAFLNSPHPLETLSDPTAYGSGGTILRDHDSSNYLKAVNGVLRQNTKISIPKVRKQMNVLWPLLTSPSPHSWNNEKNLESSVLVTKELITHV